MDIRQVAHLILRPTLHILDLHSLSAERLMLGTGAHESGGFRYLKQLGGGPALSPWGIEPATARDVIERWMQAPARGRLWALFRTAFEFEPHHSIEARLLCDLRFACAVARLIYYRVPEPLPSADDLEGLASYWKRHYNTALGRGRERDWLSNYRRHVAPAFN